MRDTLPMDILVYVQVHDEYMDRKATNVIIIQFICKVLQTLEGVANRAQ